MIVMKFGGTSVNSGEKIKTIESIVRENLYRKPVVIVSAVKGITDDLIKIANLAYRGVNVYDELENLLSKHYEIIKNLGIKCNLDNEYKSLTETLENVFRQYEKYKDEVQSSGEVISAKIISYYLNENGIKSQNLNSYDLGLTTDSNFGNAEYLPEYLPMIKRNLENLDFVPVITGYIAKDKNGNITTLGRNGSDYSAAIFANAIDAEELQIWTDVNGVLSADPKIVEKPIMIKELSFSEASELSYFGAKVLHPKTLRPARTKNIPVRVLNTLNKENPGTLIKDTNVKNGVKAIASKNKVYIINLQSDEMLGAYGHVAKFFHIFGKYRKPVDVIATSEVNVSCTVDNNEDLDSIVDELCNHGNVTLSENNTLVSIVGDGINETPEVASRTFGVLNKNKINVKMISQSVKSTNLNIIADGNLEKDIVRALHKEFIGT